MTSRIRAHNNDKSNSSSADQEFKRLLTMEPTDDCVQWSFSRNIHGYAIRGWAKKGTIYVHRQLALALLGDPPTGKPNALHSCGNGHMGCVNPHHIRWGSQRDNMMDRAAHGTDNRGERHGMRKLTEKQVIEIFQSDHDQYSIAREFNVSTRTVRSIKKGVNWGWLTSQLVSVGSKVVIKP